MHHAVLLRYGQTVGKLRSQVECTLGMESGAVHHGRELLSRHELRRDECAVRSVTGRVDRGNRRVLDRGHALCRVQHIEARAFVVGDRRRDETQRRRAANLEIARTMEFSQRAVTERRLQFEVSNDARQSDAGIILGASP